MLYLDCRILMYSYSLIYWSPLYTLGPLSLGTPNQELQSSAADWEEARPLLPCESRSAHFSPQEELQCTGPPWGQQQWRMRQWRMFLLLLCLLIGSSGLDNLRVGGLFLVGFQTMVNNVDKHKNPRRIPSLPGAKRLNKRPSGPSTQYCCPLIL